MASSRMHLNDSNSPIMIMMVNSKPFIENNECNNDDIIMTTTLYKHKSTLTNFIFRFSEKNELVKIEILVPT